MPETLLVRVNELHPWARFQSYRLLEQIGIGGQGVVWSAVDRDQSHVVAIKFIDISGSSQGIDDRVLLPQADVLLRLSHPNILPLIDLGISGQLQYMVSPYISGGSLAEWLRQGNITTEDALHCMAEIAAGLDYLHRQGVVHRDLKPGNVLLDLYRSAYITDFGLARVLSATTRAMHTGRGTPLYAPPEQHAMAKITPQSDIFSLGVMLYELLTRQLPWNGEKALGVEQLHAKAEISDPCEVNPGLPGGLVKILRLMTAPEPAVRPSSANEAIRRIFELFGLPVPLSSANNEKTVLWLRNDEAGELLARNISEWRQVGETTALSLTKFALIDMDQRKMDRPALPDESRRFMLQQALTYGYEDGYWWEQVTSPRERLDLATVLLRQKDETVTARVTRHILDDAALLASGEPPAGELTAVLLAIAGMASDPLLRKESLQVLLRLLPPGNEWRPIAIEAEQDAALAGLALEDSPQGDRAAQLVGHLRSLEAVRTLVETAPRERQENALRQVRLAAGSLPVSVPVRIRLSVLFSWLGSRLIAHPLRSLAAFTTTALGVGLGFGSVTFLSYRLMEYFDNTRLRLSLERGLFLGITFGFGLVLTRLIAGRFQDLKAFTRCLLAAIAGGMVLDAAVSSYNATILNTTARGGLIAAGSLLIALGFALGGLTRSRLWKIALALITSFAAIAGTWALHVTRAISATDLTPILKFEYGLPLVQVLGLTSIAVLPMAILANLIDLDDK